MRAVEQAVIEATPEPTGYHDPLGESEAQRASSSTPRCSRSAPSTRDYSPMADGYE